ncbi:protein FAM47B [Pungitius pungitius]|uniref:protein FAM47B n=1 Tax=Pungitius pungitius TaxID=134920 RepID=UPI002E15B6E6
METVAMESKNTRPLVPCYKEKLQRKHLKASANRTNISSVGTRRRFVTASLEDSSVSSGDGGRVSPLVSDDAPKQKSTASGQKPKKGLSKEHACFSKQMTQKQIRREYVASVEKELKRHPLAMFPHYKDHMTPELFDEVVSILDPELSVNGAARLPPPTGGHAEEDDEQVDTAQHRNSGDTLGSVNMI